MSTNCNCKNNISSSCSSQQTLDEIYKIQRRILEGSKCGNNTVIINDSVMTYVANEDFPLPICDNVRATIVNYTERNCVSKEVFEEVIDRLVAAIEDLDRRVTALEQNPPSPGHEEYDPVDEQLTVPDESIQGDMVIFDGISVIPYDVDTEGDEQYDPIDQQIIIDETSTVVDEMATVPNDMVPVDIDREN